MWADGTFILLQISGSVWGDNDDHCLGAPTNGVATGWADGYWSDHSGQTGMPGMMAPTWIGQSYFAVSAVPEVLGERIF